MTKKPLSEARIQAMIASDPDAPEATEAQRAHAKPFAEVFPALAETMRKSAGGRPKAENPKVAVSLRLDPEVVSRFKAQGAGWQTRMNEALRQAAGLN
ncbi:BrnA antitoxin family protein [Pararhodobacter zhoushanensis]|uniref:BrnA antitoxin family protein n=1 Tax=Pararhodobacter zhoushanensis TaxID=2479545 RepID=UPI000F8F29DE|nr:BrnA antitoxin family protein [Pararhodobacter zhoushanensis]